MNNNTQSSLAITDIVKTSPEEVQANYIQPLPYNQSPEKADFFRKVLELNSFHRNTFFKHLFPIITGLSSTGVLLYAAYMVYTSSVFTSAYQDIAVLAILSLLVLSLLFLYLDHKTYISQRVHNNILNSFVHLHKNEYPQILEKELLMHLLEHLQAYPIVKAQILEAIESLPNRKYSLKNFIQKNKHIDIKEWFSKKHLQIEQDIKDELFEKTYNIYYQQDHSS